MSFLTTFFVGSFLCACASPSRPCVRAFLFTLHLCRDVGARVIPEFGRSVVFSIKAERRAKEAGQLEAARQSDLSKLEGEFLHICYSFLILVSHPYAHESPVSLYVAHFLTYLCDWLNNDYGIFVSTARSGFKALDKRCQLRNSMRNRSHFISGQ